jgi:DNA segregation ATPase FtsK/SpoIIIE, S-DNA-T family
MIDPKRIELSSYDGIPHLITPVVTDVKKATNALFWAVKEMERRYELLSEKRVRNIAQYNQKITKGKKAPADLSRLHPTLINLSRLFPILSLSSMSWQTS